MNNDEALNSPPKLFANSVTIGFGKEVFFLVAYSGSNPAGAFALTPSTFKELSQIFPQKVKEYEEKHGKIDADWKPSIPSPFLDKPNP